MHRVAVGPSRPDFQELVRRQGLVYVDTELVTGEVISYWAEDTGQHYVFSASDIDVLETASNTLLGMFVTTVDHIIDNGLFSEMGIPPFAVEAIKQTWRDDRKHAHAPSVYGRFDIRYGNHPDLVRDDPSLAIPKLLEFNADTPTSLLEAAIIQWQWLEDLHPESDQWNNIHEALVQAWVYHITEYQRRTGRKVDVVHFASCRDEYSGEDMMNTAYMGDTALEAAKRLGRDDAPAFQVRYIYVEDLRWQLPTKGPVVISGGHRGTELGWFIDDQGDEVQMVFKLYPWEWLLREQGGPAICWNMLQHSGTTWIEPIYKALYANKRILAYMWELFKDKPEGKYLLPAYTADDPNIPDDILRNHARKPNLGREGADVTLVRDGEVMVEGDGRYASTGHTLQALAVLPNFRAQAGHDAYPVLGIWVAGAGDDTCAVGMSIRESSGFITDNGSRFMSHLIAG
jgi:glutathionylspermidine synthase